MSSLSAIASSSASTAEKNTQYEKALAAAGSDVAQLKAFVDHMLESAVPAATSRALLSAFAAHAAKAEPAAAAQEAMQYALDKLAPRVTAFEEQVSTLRERMADLLLDEEDWRGAARMLAEIPLDSGQRMLTATYKVGIWVKIARLYLELDDNVNAERYMNRAGELINTVAKEDEQLYLQYRVCFARIKDYKRDFLNAALKYYQLSHVELVNEDEQLLSLGEACKCALLAKAGPQRSRMLATLYKDDRVSKVPSFTMLQAMYLERLIPKREREAFRQLLSEHQTATTSDGSTVLDRAVVEHNMLAASRLYTYISIEQLGRLLEIGAERAEQIVAKMISEGRLKGHLDQIAGLVDFESDAANTQLAFDHHINIACTTVNDSLEAIAARHPDWIKARSRK